MISWIFFDFLRFSSIFFDFLRFSSIFYDFPRFPTISCDFLRFPTISDDFLRFPTISCDFLRFPTIFCDFLRFPTISCGFLRFWDGFGTVSKSGSIGTVLGTLLVPKAEFSPEENQRSERDLREHLGIRSPALLAYPRVALPLCPRTLEYLCRSKPRYGSANFGGTPRTDSISKLPRSSPERDSATQARRGLPFRPYLHARISRISGRRTTPSKQQEQEEVEEKQQSIKTTTL